MGFPEGYRLRDKLMDNCPKCNSEIVASASFTDEKNRWVHTADYSCCNKCRIMENEFGGDVVEVGVCKFAGIG